MTPFGAKVRTLRRQKGVTLKQMAGALRLSPAYLSALEHGHRSRPTPALVVQICEYFHLIWDDYEDMHQLARLSHPRVVVDTRGLSPAATELANLLADRIRDLDDETTTRLARELKASANRHRTNVAPKSRKSTGRR